MPFKPLPLLRRPLRAPADQSSSSPRGGQEGSRALNRLPPPPPPAEFYSEEMACAMTGGRSSVNTYDNNHWEIVRRPRTGAIIPYTDSYGEVLVDKHVRLRPVPKTALRDFVNRDKKAALDAISSVGKPVGDAEFICNDFFETEPTFIEDRKKTKFISDCNYVKTTERIALLNQLMSMRPMRSMVFGEQEPLFPEAKIGKTGFKGLKVLVGNNPQGLNEPGEDDGIFWEKTNVDSLGTAELAILVCHLQKDWKLELKVMGLESIHKIVLLRASLTHLNLAFNNFSSFPREILTLELLEYLNMRDNPIESLPNEIWYLKKLKYLCISFNRLSTLPPGICFCSNLRNLDLSYNTLTILPYKLGLLTKLAVLNVEGNQLIALPNSVVHCPFKRLLVGFNYMTRAFWKMEIYQPPSSLKNQCCKLIVKQQIPWAHYDMDTDMKRYLLNPEYCDRCNSAYYGSGFKFIRLQTLIEDNQYPLMMVLCSSRCLLTVKAKYESPFQTTFNGVKKMNLKQIGIPQRVLEEMGLVTEEDQRRFLEQRQTLNEQIMNDEERAHLKQGRALKKKLSKKNSVSFASSKNSLSKGRSLSVVSSKASSRSLSATARRRAAEEKAFELGHTGADMLVARLHNIE
eukprot:Nk52_evm33s226 gene=Nk52_evmTU33s226